MSRDKQFLINIKKKYYNNYFEQFKEQFRYNTLYIKSYKEKCINQYSIMIDSKLLNVKTDFLNKLKSLEDKSINGYLKFKKENYDIPIDKIMKNEYLEYQNNCIKKIKDEKTKLRILFRKKWIKKLGVNILLEFIEKFLNDKHFISDTYKELEEIEFKWVNGHDK